MKYGIVETLKNAYALICTKFFYRGARLIRRPIYLRGKNHMQFGMGFTTGYNCRFDLDGEGVTLIIGKDCRLGDNVHIVAQEKVIVGDNNLWASKIFVSDTSHGVYDGIGEEYGPKVAPNDRKLYTAPVCIGNNVWLGENVCVLKGVTIGDGCIIGANTTVTKSIPDGCIAVGNPAQVIKKWNEGKKCWESVRNRQE